MKRDGLIFWFLVLDLRYIARYRTPLRAIVGAFLMPLTSISKFGHGQLLSAADGLRRNALGRHQYNTQLELWRATVQGRSGVYDARLILTRLRDQD